MESRTPDRQNNIEMQLTAAIAASKRRRSITEETETKETLIPITPTDPHLHHHNDTSNRALKLIRNTPIALITRLLSMGAFYFGFQLYLRTNQLTLARGAMLALLINISSILREGTRECTTATKEELEKSAQLIKAMSEINIETLEKIIGFINEKHDATSSEIAQQLKTNNQLELSINLLTHLVDCIKKSSHLSNTEIEKMLREGYPQAIREMYLTTEFSAILPTLMTWGCNQALLLIAESLMTDPNNQQIYDDLRWTPTEFAINYYFLNRLMVLGNRSYALQELKVILASYGTGGIVMVASSLGLKQILQPTNTFYIANLMQNVTTNLLLSCNNYFRHGQLKLHSTLSELNLWRPAFTRAVKLNIKSLSFVLILAFELIFDALGPLFITANKEQAGALTALKVITNMFGSLLVLDQLYIVESIGISKTHECDPEKLRKELNQVLWTGIGTTLSITGLFTLFAILFKGALARTLVEDTDANIGIINRVEADLIWACIMIIFRVRGPFAVTIAHSKDEPLLSKLATAINCAPPIFGFLSGVLMGDTAGFWQGGSAALFVSMILQLGIALRVINNQAEVAELRRENKEIKPAASTRETAKGTPANQGIFAQMYRSASETIAYVKSSCHL